MQKPAQHGSRKVHDLPPDERGHATKPLHAFHALPVRHDLLPLVARIWRKVWRYEVTLRPYFGCLPAGHSSDARTLFEQFTGGAKRTAYRRAMQSAL
jgi:hypothetical protein